MQILSIFLSVAAAVMSLAALCIATVPAEEKEKDESFEFELEKEFDEIMNYTGDEK
ncbi:MAG: hypothetical protein IJD95_03150 [Clostridia bacterium]|nr:hypothetical protein [Clostridia bacterium]